MTEKEISIVFDEDIIKGHKCPYCEVSTKYVDSSVIYGRSYGMMFLCPECKSFVGTHKNSGKAYGRLANKELRELKKQAHAEFDKLWNCKPKERLIKNIKSRNEAYKWLSNKLGTPIQFTHIGMFDDRLCKRVIELMGQVVKSQSGIKRSIKRV